LHAQVMIVAAAMAAVAETRMEGHIRGRIMLKG
jgi:hypothetical protein